MSEFLRLTVEAEFHEDEDLPALLRKLADRLEREGAPVLRAIPLLDENGNRVGSALLEDVA